MNNINLDLDWAWKKMHDAYFDDAKYVTIRSCRRSFKTLGASKFMIEKLIENPNKTGIWIDTVNKNLDRYYERYFHPLINEISTFNYQKKTLKFVNGSYLDFGSAESPENLEGFEYDYAILNEAGIILKKDSLWDNSIKPMLKNAEAVRIVGTPKGKNLFHRLCNLNEEDWSHYNYTIYDCPFYSDQEIEKIKKETPRNVFKQEYLAEFIDGSGSVFRNISQCISHRIDDSPKLNCRYVMSVDLAKHVDFTVIYIADLDTKEVVFQDRFNKIDWGFQKKRIFNLYKTWNIQELIIDSTGVGDTIFDDLRNLGLNVQSFKFTSTSKKQLVENLSVVIDNQDIRYFAFPELIAELEIYEAEITKSGNISYNAPSGYHDDCVMSLALINKLINNNNIVSEHLFYW